MRRLSKEVNALQVQMGVELQTYGWTSVQVVYPTRCSILKTASIKSYTKRSHCDNKPYVGYELTNPYHLNCVICGTHLVLSLSVCSW